MYLKNPCNPGTGIISAQITQEWESFYAIVFIMPQMFQMFTTQEQEMFLCISIAFMMMNSALANAMFHSSLSGNTK